MRAKRNGFEVKLVCDKFDISAHSFKSHPTTVGRDSAIYQWVDPLKPATSCLKTRHSVADY
jgi:hypothetical protein